LLTKIDPDRLNLNDQVVILKLKEGSNVVAQNLDCLNLIENFDFDDPVQKYLHKNSFFSQLLNLLEAY